jgi:hypothetical protein
MAENNEDGTIDYTQIEINFQQRTEMRAQQTMSLLDPFIVWATGKGREAKVTFWGGQAGLAQKSQRHQTYPQFQTEREAYWFGSVHFWAKEPIDGDDALYDAVDAGAGLSQVWGAAAARERDKTAIRTAIGTAYRGRYGKTAAQRLPPSQIIAHGNTGMTEAKIRKGVAMLRRTHPDQLDPICTFLTSEQLTGDLMGENKVINSDYSDQRPLKDLALAYFLGTYFRLLDDYAQFEPEGNLNVATFDPILPILANGVAAGQHIRYCVMFVKSAMRGKKERPVLTRLHDEEKDHGPGAKSLTIDFMEGYTRVDPLGVVVIECVETAPLAITA